MNVTTATPVEIDAKLAELYGIQNAAEARMAVILADVHNLIGDRGRKVRGRGTVYNFTDVEALDQAAEIVAGNAAPARGYDATTADRLLISCFATATIIADAIDEAAPLNAEYNRRPWARFFLVTSSNGHIHSSMDCSTCTSRTQFGWLPEASGQTEAEAIAERDKLDSAALLCTVCFPNAPVEWTVKPVDDTVCPGSGTTNYDRTTARTGYYSGNFGICNDCGQPATIPGQSGIKMRKHRKA